VEQQTTRLLSVAEVSQIEKRTTFMKTDAAKTIYLSDYQAPDYFVETIELTFVLDENDTLVTATSLYRKNPDIKDHVPLVLQGENLTLLSVNLNQQTLSADDYQLDEYSLTIPNVPDQSVLTIETRIEPQNNTSLEGLYKSSGNFCTQCEAQGFRKITYYLDRPDVLAEFTTQIIANKKRYPVLLANGNLTNSGDIGDGRHWTTWHDPHPKPAYLFALVAGDLQHVEDQFTTAKGDNVRLQIFTEAHNIDKCDHAMASLKRAMQWDESRFGLSYDLANYMIVAVDDFNMGAMENKGLNIFNSKLVFASPATATDHNYIAIEAVIGHEYFHNWTGNRVTCRDWFQLSLKEGLTVFRDQEFTADLHSRALKRIEDVRLLRAHQFAEDASPMAHPIRPSSFVEINNFYTVTVYEKGAEVVRLYHTLLGEAGFRKGMDLYVQRHDGQAVTTEDFLAAMADANQRDLSQMQVWYAQAGTPQLHISMDYDADHQTCTLHFRQENPQVEHSKPYLMPVKLGLLDQQGEAYALSAATDGLIVLDQVAQSLVFTQIDQRPIPSLLRDFSAPVQVHYDYSAADYAFLMQYDQDAFNRWDASQQLAIHCLLQMLEAYEKDDAYGLEPTIVDAYQAVLNNEQLDPALRAEALSLPTQSELVERSKPADPTAIFAVREFMHRTLANALRVDFERHYQALTQNGAYQIDQQSMAQRRLRNMCLHYLSYVNDDGVENGIENGVDQGIAALIHRQFKQANNMTDQLAALTILCELECSQREQAIKAFAEQWQDDALVMDKWFAAQASSKRPNTLATVQTLMQHPRFSLKNPNKVRALIGAFANANPINFHAEDGSGYAFIAEQVLALDSLNPQIASRLVRSLMNWQHYEPKRAELMRQALQCVAAKEDLSNDVAEIVQRSLKTKHSNNP